MTLMDDLLNLFRVDSQWRGLENRVKSAELYLRAQQRKLDEVVEQHQELESRHRQLQAEIHNSETEISAFSERIEKHRAEMNAAQTTKEFAALQSEVVSLKEKKADVEVVVLELMERVEELKTELDRLKQEVAEREHHRDRAQTELDERRVAVGERLTELERDRNVAAANIPRAELGVFEELANQYDGDALAAIHVVDVRNREYACGECNMHMPFEAVSVLVTSDNTLVRCTACARILYLAEETRGELLARK